VPRVHRGLLNMNEHHAVCAANQAYRQNTHTGQIEHNRHGVCVPESRKHSLEQKKGAGVDKLGVLAMQAHSSRQKASVASTGARTDKTHHTHTHTRS
jgi:hypothetical protein